MTGAVHGLCTVKDGINLEVERIRFVTLLVHLNRPYPADAMKWHTSNAALPRITRIVGQVAKLTVRICTVQ